VVRRQEGGRGRKRREREQTVSSCYSCTHVRRFELLQLDVWLQGLNTPQILKLSEIFRDVLRENPLLVTYTCRGMYSTTNGHTGWIIILWGLCVHHFLPAHVYSCKYDQ
jgi:hypothetical protein